MTEISYDQLISELIDARVYGDDAVWRQAAIVYFLRHKLKAKMRSISADTGYSPRYLTDLAHTFSAYPEEGDRSIELSYSHHQEAARTDDPAYWIAEATDQGWSVRELKRAIKGEPVRKTDLEVAEALWEKIETVIAQQGEGAAYLWQRITEAQR